jgi:hypothetical protein
MRARIFTVSIDFNVNINNKLRAFLIIEWIWNRRGNVTTVNIIQSNATVTPVITALF